NFLLGLGAQRNEKERRQHRNSCNLIGSDTHGIPSSEKVSRPRTFAQAPSPLTRHSGRCQSLKLLAKVQQDSPFFATGSRRPGEWARGPIHSAIFSPLFLRRMERLAETEVQLEAVQPGDPGVDAFGSELGG